MKGIIYCAENNINGKCYIGQTIKTLKERKQGHSRTIHLSHNNFHRALLKYDDWNWYVVQEYEASTRELLKKVLDKAEIYYIEAYDSFNNGYNMTKGGKGSIGRTLSEKTKEKIRTANKNKKISKKHAEALHSATRGKPLSIDHKKKLSISNLKPGAQPKAKKIRCVETGVIYNSIYRAAYDMHIGRRGISLVVNGKQQTSGGYHWEIV